MKRPFIRTTWNFHSAAQLLFGRNAVEQLGDIALRLRGKRALLVTDPILTKAGIAERVRAPLQAAGIAVESFNEGEPEPSLRGTKRGREGRESNSRLI